MHQRKPLRWVLLVGTLIFLSSVKSHAEVTLSQIHLRAGMVMASFSAPGLLPEEASFSVMPTFDVEYERYLNIRSSYVLKGVFAMDLATSIVKYYYAGVGQRFYFGSLGTAVVADSPGISVVSQPKMRYYIGYDVGISQTVIKSFTSSLQVFTSMVDIGGTVGFIYQMTKNMGIEGLGGVSYGYGFSSVAISGLFMKGFFGMTYYF